MLSVLGVLRLPFFTLISAVGLASMALLSTTLAVAENQDQTRTFKVGVFDNPPIVFRAENGRISGLAPDVVDYIAAQEGWKIQYVHGSWKKVYTLLEKGELDLLVGIAYSEKRTKLFQFTEQTLVNNWGVVYQAGNGNLTSLHELEGKRIALMRKSIHSKVFAKLMEGFGFSFRSVEVANYDAVVQAIDDNSADAGVINRVFSFKVTTDYNVKPTSIIFNPVEVRFASPKKSNVMLSAIDRHLSEAKVEKNSFYYVGVEKWLSQVGAKRDVTWWIWLSAGVGIFLLLSILYSYHVSRLVAFRTRELGESESRFRQVADKINQVFWIWSSDLKQISYISPAYEKIWGRSCASLYHAPESLLEAIHESDRDLFINDVKQRILVGAAELSPHQFRILKPDGAVRWIRTRLYPVVDELHKVEKIVGFAEDVTESYEAGEALRKSEERLRLALSASGTGTWEWEITSNRVTWSEGVERIFGMEPGSFDGTYETYQKRIHPDDLAIVENTIRETMESSKRYKVEHRIVWADGSVHWISGRGEVFRDEGGRPLRMLGIVTDVTERHNTELELRNYRDNLEDLVAERTGELEALNNELEAFSYSVSHDLKGPLRAIDGFSLALLEDFEESLGDEGSDYLKRIRVGANRMSQLIDDILQLSRVSRTELKRQNVELNTVGAEVIRELEEREPLRRVIFKVHPGLEANCDEQLMRIVLENLLGNAWKYTSKKEAAEIEFGKIRIDGKMTFFVKDDGAGFDMRFIDKLFGAFQRLHRADDFEGTGVGLATVQRIIHRHGGRIWAQAEVGKGATFYFNLP